LPITENILQSHTYLYNSTDFFEDKNESSPKSIKEELALRTPCLCTFANCSRLGRCIGAMGLKGGEGGGGSMHLSYMLGEGVQGRFETGIGGGEAMQGKIYTPNTGIF
jgi:hypothetical protein